MQILKLNQKEISLQCQFLWLQSEKHMYPVFHPLAVMTTTNLYDVMVVGLWLNLPQTFGVFASILLLVRLHWRLLYCTDSCGRSLPPCWSETTGRRTQCGLRRRETFGTVIHAYTHIRTQWCTHAHKLIHTWKRTHLLLLLYTNCYNYMMGQPLQATIPPIVNI